MRLLFIAIFSIVTTFISAQRDTVTLCNFSAKRIYWVKNELGLPVEWSVDPEVSFVQRGESIEVTWLDLGTYVITSQYTTDYCQGPKGYKVVEVVECKETFFWVPSSFTPNYDGLNEGFGAVGLNILEYKMEIYDRWGSLIFVSRSLEDKWYGTRYETNPVIDVYTYRISYRDINLRYHEVYGRVTLVE
jgi:gliding motility-associated-like protein